MRRIPLVFFATLLAFASMTEAATLVPDASFGAGGSKNFNLQGLTPLWRFARVLPGGKILLAGKSCEFAGCSGSTFTLARLNADGSLDRTFRPNDAMPGTLHTYGWEIGWTKFDIAGMNVDSQNRIVIVGRNASTPASGDLIIVRLLANGDRDSAFNSAGAEPGVYRRTLSAHGSVQGMAIDSQDRIVVVGHVFDTVPKSLPYATRINANGTTDFTFNVGGAIPGLWTPPPAFDGGLASSVMLDGTGRIVVAGMAGAAMPQTTTQQFRYLRGLTYNGFPFVARLQGNGAPDTSFNAAGALPGIATLAGFNAIATRYLANRALLALDSLGRILVGGETQFGGARGLAVFRLLTDGTEDPTAWSYSPSWPAGGRNTPVTPLTGLGVAPTFLAAGGMEVDGSDNIYISGLYLGQEGLLNDARPILFRANSTTQPDATFAPSLGGSPPTVGVREFDVSASALQAFGADPADGLPDGISLAIDITGNAVVPTPGQLPQADGPVLRIKPAGTLDPAFGSGGVAFTGGTGNANYPYLGLDSLSLFTDGTPAVAQSIIRDWYGSGNYTGMIGIVRLTTGGQVDETINPAGHPPGLVTYWPDYDRAKFAQFGNVAYAMIRDSDDKLVVVSLGRSGSNNAPMVVRFNSDGSIDPTFNASGPYPGSIVQPVGSLNAVGFQVVQDASKRYYVTGYAYEGNKNVAFVFRLNNNGTLDPTFSDGANPYAIVRFGPLAQSDCSNGSALSLASNNKVLVTGIACIAGSSTIAGIGVARLNGDGRRDLTFNPGGLLPGAVIVPAPPGGNLATSAYDIAETALGNILVTARYGPAGGFIDQWGAGIARLTPTGQLDLGFGTQGYWRCSSCLGNDYPAQLTRDGAGGFYYATTGIMDLTGGPARKPPLVMRLDAEGVVDTTFAGGGTFAINAGGFHQLHHLLVDPSGRIVVAGWNRATASAPVETWVARYSVAASPLVLQAAFSRMTHGAAGAFDLPLSLVAPPAINHNPTTEPRAGGSHTLVFTFDQPLTGGTAAVSEGTATVGAPTFVGNSILVPLSGVTDAQYVTVEVSSVTSSGGGTGSASARVGFLLGDVNGSRVVTVADVALVNAQLAQPVTAANYLKDVNANGTLTLADKGLTNANLTHALPAP